MNLVTKIDEFTGRILQIEFGVRTQYLFIEDELHLRADTYGTPKKKRKHGRRYKDEESEQSCHFHVLGMGWWLFKGITDNVTKGYGAERWHDRSILLQWGEVAADLKLYLATRRWQ